MTKLFAVQSREQREYNTDPQRRCYNGCHFSSEWRWTEWRTLYDVRTREEAEESVANWRALALTAKPRVLEYRYLEITKETRP